MNPTRLLTVAWTLTASIVGLRDAPAQCGALEFDGATYVTVPYSSAFPTGEFTLSAWIKRDAQVDLQCIIARGENELSDNFSWWFGIQGDGQLVLRLEDTFDNDVTYSATTSGLGDVGWHHVAATRALDKTVEIYADGALVATHAGTVDPSGDPQALTIGCLFGSGATAMSPQPPSRHFVGLIDEVTIWNQALTGPQISALHQTPPAPGGPGVIGYWRFDEGSGQSVADASGSGNDGTLGINATAAADDPVRVPDAAPDLSNPAIVDLGFALAGSSGAPELAAEGPLCAGSQTMIELSSAAPSAPCYWIAGLAQANTPFLGGTLVPSVAPPSIVLPLVTSAGGGIAFAIEWPALPSGTALFLQVWVTDAGAPVGFAASNALKLESP